MSSLKDILIILFIKYNITNKNNNSAITKENYFPDTNSRSFEQDLFQKLNLINFRDLKISIKPFLNMNVKGKKPIWKNDIYEWIINHMFIKNEKNIKDLVEKRKVEKENIFNMFQGHHQGELETMEGVQYFERMFFELREIVVPSDVMKVIFSYLRKSEKKYRNEMFKVVSLVNENWYFLSLWYFFEKIEICKSVVYRIPMLVLLKANDVTINMKGVGRKELKYLFDNIKEMRCLTLKGEINKNQVIECSFKKCIELSVLCNTCSSLFIKHFFTKKVLPNVKVLTVSDSVYTSKQFCKIEIEFPLMKVVCTKPDFKSEVRHHIYQRVSGMPTFLLDLIDCCEGLVIINSRKIKDNGEYTLILKNHCPTTLIVKMKDYNLIKFAEFFIKYEENFLNIKNLEIELNRDLKIIKHVPEFINDRIEKFNKLEVFCLRLNYNVDVLEKKKLDKMIDISKMFSSVKTWEIISTKSNYIRNNKKK